MKWLVLAVLLAAVLGFNIKQVSSNEAATCPHDKEVVCVHDFNLALKDCRQAAAERKLNPTLECIKDSAQMGEDCVECICFFANYFKVPVIGC